MIDRVVNRMTLGGLDVYDEMFPNRPSQGLPSPGPSYSYKHDRTRISIPRDMREGMMDAHSDYTAALNASRDEGE